MSIPVVKFVHHHFGAVENPLLDNNAPFVGGIGELVALRDTCLAGGVNCDTELHGLSALDCCGIAFCVVIVLAAAALGVAKRRIGGPPIWPLSECIGIWYIRNGLSSGDAANKINS